MTRPTEDFEISPEYKKSGDEYFRYDDNDLQGRLGVLAIGSFWQTYYRKDPWATVEIFVRRGSVGRWCDPALPLESGIRLISDKVAGKYGPCKDVDNLLSIMREYQDKLDRFAEAHGAGI